LTTYEIVSVAFSTVDKFLAVYNPVQFTSIYLTTSSELIQIHNEAAIIDSGSGSI